MLTTYSHSQFVEKILTDSCGRQFKAVFFVTLLDGEVRGRLVSIQPISSKVLSIAGEVSDGTICLPTWTGKEEIETTYFAPAVPTVSPYFNIDLILTSQPTRAPSYN